MKKASSIVLRVGIAIVIIWFGIQQLVNPTQWVAYLPTWINHLPFSQLSIIYINGWFETVFGIMLLFGFYTRFVSILLALHMLDIAYTVGYGAIGVRDFGLAISTLSIFLYGMSPLSVDMFFATNEEDAYDSNNSRNSASDNADIASTPASMTPKATAKPIMMKKITNI